MPFAIGGGVLLAIICAVHALRTGRNMYWLFLLFMFPGLGAIVYYIVEILPEMGGNRHLRAARSVAQKAIDPEREVRAAMHQLEVTRTPGNLKRAGDALIGAGRGLEAVAVYREATSGPFGDDPALLAGRARAEFEAGDSVAALATLDALRAARPNLRMPDAHLTYARALEGAGRTDEALAEYEAVAVYYPGAEPRARWALLLEKLGRGDEARERWTEITAAARIAPRFARQAQREWIDMAKAHGG